MKISCSLHSPRVEYLKGTEKITLNLHNDIYIYAYLPTTMFLYSPTVFLVLGSTKREVMHSWKYEELKHPLLQFLELGKPVQNPKQVPAKQKFSHTTFKSHNSRFILSTWENIFSSPSPTLLLLPQIPVSMYSENDYHSKFRSN